MGKLEVEGLRIPCRIRQTATCDYVLHSCMLYIIEHVPFDELLDIECTDDRSRFGFGMPSETVQVQVHLISVTSRVCQLALAAQHLNSL